MNIVTVSSNAANIFFIVLLLRLNGSPSTTRTLIYRLISIALSVRRQKRRYGRETENRTLMTRTKTSHNIRYMISLNLCAGGLNTASSHVVPYSYHAVLHLYWSAWMDPNQQLPLYKGAALAELGYTGINCSARKESNLNLSSL